MKQRKPYKTFTGEFKQEAVRLMETTDRPASEVAMELGIRRNQLYKWKNQLAEKGEAAFSRRGRPRKENQSERRDNSPGFSVALRRPLPHAPGCGRKPGCLGRSIRCHSNRRWSGLKDCLPVRSHRGYEDLPVLFTGNGFIA